MSSARRELLLSTLAITLTTLLTYGVLAQRLGFYRDDWYLVWTWQAQGVKGILNLFVGDRPFDGWLYAFDFWLAGVSPLRWQVYALLVKLSSALAFFWLLRSLWGESKLETTFIALLFVVYPGYFQQPNAMTAKQLLLSYAAALLSLALTVNAVKAQRPAHKILWTVLAALLSAFYMLIYEALIGIEVARALLLAYYFYQQTQNWRQAFKAAALNALPYFIFMGTFLFWRLFIFDATRKSTDVGNIAGNYASLHGLIGMALEYVKDLVETSFFAWGVPLYQFWNQATYKELGGAAALALAVILLGAGYYFAVKQPVAGREKNAPARDWIILGGLIIAATTLPVVAAGRNVIFGVQWDRYTYQSIFGVALLLGGIVFYAVKGNLRWALLAALLISGAMTQFLSASFYRAYWEAERQAFWQLSWRAPQIEAGTTLILSMPGPYSPAEEYEIWAPLDMVYYPNATLDLAGQIMSDKIWVDLARGTLEERLVRGTITVKRNYEQALVLSQPAPNACLHVLDGARFEQAVTESADARQIARYSNTGLIHTAAEAAIPPAEIFGGEPARGWCYYYQKMDLARQTGDWQKVAALAEEAAARDLSPSDVTEWLPALEAYVHLNDAQNIKRTGILIRTNRTVAESLCANYKALRDQPADYDRTLLFDALCAR